MKSFLRKSKASGSTKRRVDEIVRRGGRYTLRQFNSSRRRELRNEKGAVYHAQ